MGAPPPQSPWSPEVPRAAAGTSARTDTQPPLGIPPPMTCPGGGSCAHFTDEASEVKQAQCAHTLCCVRLTSSGGTPASPGRPLLSWGLRTAALPGRGDSLSQWTPRGHTFSLPPLMLRRQRLRSEEGSGPTPHREEASAFSQRRPVWRASQMRLPRVTVPKCCPGHSRHSREVVLPFGSRGNRGSEVSDTPGFPERVHADPSPHRRSPDPWGHPTVRAAAPTCPALIEGLAFLLCPPRGQGRG